MQGEMQRIVDEQTAMLVLALARRWRHLDPGDECARRNLQMATSIALGWITHPRSADLHRLLQLCREA